MDISYMPQNGPSIYNISSNGPIYSIIISKLNNDIYSGIIWSYADYSLQDSPWYFLRVNNNRLLKKLL